MCTCFKLHMIPKLVIMLTLLKLIHWGYYSRFSYGRSFAGDELLFAGDSFFLIITFFFTTKYSQLAEGCLTKHLELDRIICQSKPSLNGNIIFEIYFIFKVKMCTTVSEPVNRSLSRQVLV